jgi:hypothetical protein
VADAITHVYLADLSKHSPDAVNKEIVYSSQEGRLTIEGV